MSYKQGLREGRFWLAVERARIIFGDEWFKVSLLIKAGICPGPTAVRDFLEQLTTEINEAEVRGSDGPDPEVHFFTKRKKYPSARPT